MVEISSLAHKLSICSRYSHKDAEAVIKGLISIGGKLSTIEELIEEQDLLSLEMYRTALIVYRRNSNES